MSGAGALPSDEQLARDLRRAVVGIHRVRWILAGAMAAVVVVAIVAIGVVLAGEHRQLVSERQQVTDERQQVTADEARLRASCAFYHDIATLPVTAQPPATRPGEIGVALVVHSREAYAGQACGALPPEPGPLRRWAAFYHLVP